LKTDNCISLESGVGWYDFEEIDETENDVKINIAAFYGNKWKYEF
jgi:hypothetical protein